jgi:hypothetical protein
MICFQYCPRSLVATDDISRGEEIFVKYNYPIGSPGTQQWYIDMYEKEVGPWPSVVIL